MKQTLPLLISTLFLMSPLSGQIPIWDKEVAIGPNAGNSHSLVVWQDGHLLFSHSKTIGEATIDGVISGHFVPTVSAASPAGTSRYLRMHTDPLTGQKYFLLGYRPTNGASNALRFVEYRPGKGLQNDKALDETFAASTAGFAVVDLDDTSFLAVANKFVRKLHVKAGQSVEVDWEKPLNKGDINATVRADTLIVAVSQAGEIFAMRKNGDVLWAKPAGFIARGIRYTKDGLVTCCGNTVGGKAVLAKFTLAGDVVWSKEYDGKRFGDLIEDSDGDLVATGVSTTDKLLLLKTDATGTLLWAKSYLGVQGWGVLQAPDGGYCVIGFRTGPNIIRLLKTDQDGNTAPYESGDASRVRSIGNGTIKAAFGPSPALFRDGNRQGFFAPKDSSTSLFFTSSLWMGGSNKASGDLHTTAGTFYSTNTDYKTGLSFGSRPNDFKRVWRLNREEIYQMRLDWADNGILDQPVPHDIATWPAKGNTRYTQGIDFLPVATDPALFPAPFTDLNGDGSYNPADGDFPLIKGDNMTWWLLSDSTLHYTTLGNPFMVDVAVSAYTYDHPGNSLEASLFTNFQILNRSIDTYEDVFVGSWNDLDLGCPDDDYIGSIPASHAFYAYNQDNADGQPGYNCNGIATFRDKIPVASVMMLNQSLDRLMYYNNSSSGSPLPQTTDPATGTEYYNYLQSKWRDGLPLSAVGSGYNPPLSQSTDYAFPDNPADPASWSMCTANLPFSDRRLLGSHGPFTFAPGDTFQLNLAYTYHPDIPHPCPDISGQVKNDLDGLRSLVGSGVLGDPIQFKLFTKIQPGQTVSLDPSIAGASYQWSTGAVTPTITISQPGVYQVTITRANGYRTKEVAVVRASSPVSDPAEQMSHFRLFPNPAAGQFTVEINTDTPGEVEFDLLNGVGQTVRREVVATGQGLLVRTFDCTQLPAGAYALRVRANGQLRYARVAVQR